MTRLQEIRARLGEVHPRTGREMWHAADCDAWAGYDCGCWRTDVVWLVEQLAATRAAWAAGDDPDCADVCADACLGPCEGLDVTGAPPRCRARLIEHTDRARSWRCQLAAGHAGDHRSRSGHRRWQRADDTVVVR